jgi:tetratricopeptide (TPR) repeat protein
MRIFMKFIISILTLVMLQHLPVSAQNISLKKPLTADDFKILDKELDGCLSYEVSIIFTFNTWDFYDNKNVMPDTPNSIKQVQELEKQLKGNYRDATLYNNIGMAYKGMFMFDEANKNFDKAFELAQVYVKNHPDSAIAHSLMATVYSNQGKFTEAIASFETVYKLDKNDSVAKFMIPACYTFAGNFEEAKAALNRLLTKPEDEFDYLCVLTVTNYWEKMVASQQMQGVDIEKLLKDKSPQEILDFTKIDELCKRNKGKIEFELVYRFNRHMAVFLKSFMRTMASKDITADNIKFKTDEKDIAELNALEAFYTKCLNDTGIHNKYILYKSLANIQLLKGDFKKAIPLTKMAIKLKPVNKSKFDNNAAGDYDNLGAVFYLLKDTAGFERTVKEKFAVRPAINPLPDDNATLARISFFHKDYAAAKKNSEEGLKMNPKLETAIICLAALDILDRNIKSAFKMIDRLYDANPQNASVFILQGICSLHDNDISTAYGSFKRARELVGDPSTIDGILERFFLVN